MPIFPARAIDAVSWIAGAAVTHLDHSSRSVSATCWSASRELNEMAADFFLATVGNRVSDPNQLSELATSRPSEAFDYCHALLSNHESSELTQIAKVIEAKTRLVFHRSTTTETAGTHVRVHIDKPIDVVIPYRAVPGNPLRARNLAAVLSALQTQTAEPSQYRVTVVEESDIPTVPADPRLTVDNYIHIPYTGPFNKALAINRGVSDSDKDSILCLLDADILPDHDFLQRNAARVSASPDRLHLPYHDAFCLLSDDSKTLATEGYMAGRTYSGYLITHPAGGCVWITHEAFDEAEGFDENFVGWGGEDRDFADRADRVAPILRHRELLTHLYHERPMMPSSRKEIMAAVGKTFDGEDD